MIFNDSKSSWSSADQALVGWRISRLFHVVSFKLGEFLVSIENPVQGLWQLQIRGNYFVVKGILAIKRVKLYSLCGIFEEEVTQVFTLQAALQRTVAKKELASQTAACMVGLWQLSHWIKVSLIFVLFWYFLKALYAENNTRVDCDKEKLYIRYVAELCFPANSKFLRKTHAKISQKPRNDKIWWIIYGYLQYLILHISYLQPNYRQWNSFKMAEKEWHFTIDR